jgi:hypothetical protein
MAQKTPNKELNRWVNSVLAEGNYYWKQVSYDTHGNPRIAVYFTLLVRDDVSDAINRGTDNYAQKIERKYAIAHEIAKKAGGRIHQGKDWSYHFVFPSWNHFDTFKKIYDAMQEISDKAIQTGIL